MKTKFLLMTLFISLIVVEAVNIFMSNSIAGSSIEVSKIKEGIQRVEEDNTTVKTELLTLSSFENISSRAAELGFSENKETAIMINVPLKMALR